MGCLESKIQPDPYGSYGFNNSGGGSGASVGESCCTVEDNSVSEWKQKMSEADALALFESDGTLPKNSTRGQLELRALLSEPVSQPILGNYAKSHNGLNFFLCWIDIQEYKSIETGPYRLSKAVLLYKKYIEAGSILDIQLNDDEKDVIEASLELSKTDNVPISNSFYTEAQKFCFEQIYHKLFVPFKKTDEYRALTKILKESYNFVRTDDFVYIKKLGEGGFGFVVQAMKLSTRQHYAMKIQTKRGLLSCFPEDPWRADSERKALATSQHPFIINLEYAFQTDTLAIMVLGLGTSGDLRHALRQSISRTLPFDRVQFYAAEMVSGLCHLHDMGLIYRDLKPNNILLNADGHIQLVDLGAVADTDGYVLEVEENPEDPPDVLAVFETASCQRAGRSPHLRSQAVSPAISPGNTHNPRYEGNEDKPLEPDQLVKMTKTTAVGDVETDEVKAAKAAIEAESGADPDDPNHVYIKSDVPVAKKKEDEMAAASSPEGQSLSIRKRAYTIIGTYGYMAPEMVILLSQEPHEKVGYTHSVE